MFPIRLSDEWCVGAQAIIVENYMKVREKIKGMHTENEMTYHVGLTIYHYMLGIFYRWSRRRRIRGLIAFRCAKKSISWLELYVLGVSEKAAVSLIDSFAAMPAVKSSAPVKKRTEAEQGLDATKSTSINVHLLEKATKASDQRQTRSDDGNGWTATCPLGAHVPASEFSSLTTAVQEDQPSFLQESPSQPSAPLIAVDAEASRLSSHAEDIPIIVIKPGPQAPQFLLQYADILREESTRELHDVSSRLADGEQPENIKEIFDQQRVSEAVASLPQTNQPTPMARRRRRSLPSSPFAFAGRTHQKEPAAETRNSLKAQARKMRAEARRASEDAGQTLGHRSGSGGVSLSSLFPTKASTSKMLPTMPKPTRSAGASRPSHRLWILRRRRCSRRADVSCRIGGRRLLVPQPAASLHLALGNVADTLTDAQPGRTRVESLCRPRE